MIDLENEIKNCEGKKAKKSCTVSFCGQIIKMVEGISLPECYETLVTEAYLE